MECSYPSAAVQNIGVTVNPDGSCELLVILTDGAVHRYGINAGAIQALATMFGGLVAALASRQTAGRMTGRKN